MGVLLQIVAMTAIITALQDLAWIVYSLWLVGGAGRRRLRAMGEDPFRRVDRAYRRAEPPAAAVSSAVVLAVLAVVALVMSEHELALAIAVGAAALAPGGLIAMRARRAVAAEAARRALPPLTYQHSERRLARQRQLGVGLGVGVVVGMSSLGASQWLGRGWLGGLGLGVLATCLLVGLLGLWTGLWVYGDEEAREEPR